MTTQVNFDKNNQILPLDGELNEVGDQIQYSFEIVNQGNTPIIEMELSDSLLGLASVEIVAGIQSGAFNVAGDDGDQMLEVGETWTITEGNGTVDLTYSVTQEDFDSNGTAENSGPFQNQTGQIDNAGSLLSFGADSTSASSLETSAAALTVTRSIAIDKTATVADGIADEVGEDIDYTIKVTATGNAAVAGVTVSDPLLDPLVGPTGDTDGDGLLDVNETWIYTGSYELTQADLDEKTSIDNTATASGTGVPSVSDTVSVPLVTHKILHIEKDPDKTSVSLNGETITYTMLVSHDTIAGSNSEISNIVVNDPFTSDEAPVLNGGFNVGDTDTDDRLDVGETWEFTASHTVTQDDLDDKTSIDNVATVTGDDATPDSDDATVPVEVRRSIAIDKSATVEDGVADEVGDKINYTVVVTNTGNAAVNGVTVSDPLINPLSGPTGDTDNDGRLDVNETWTYTGSYMVTQADLDDDPGSHNGGDDDIDNVATAMGENVPNVSDDATVPLIINRSMAIDKTCVVEDGKADEVSDIINYTINLTNTGNAVVRNVVVSDPLLGGNLPAPPGDTDGDGDLDVGETWTYNLQYVVTQADLEGGGAAGPDDSIDNIATATGDGALSVTDVCSVPVIPAKGILVIDKEAQETSVDEAGDIIHYTIKVTNDGNSAVDNVVVTDPFTDDEAPVLDGSHNIGDLDDDDRLDPGEIWQYTASHIVTQAEIDAGTPIVNTATASGEGVPSVSDTETVPIIDCPGVHSPGNCAGIKTYWDGIIGNESQVGHNLPAGELLDFNDINGDDPGNGRPYKYVPYILLGDEDSDGQAGAGETTVRISIADALKMVGLPSADGANNKSFDVVRQVIAAQLNFELCNDDGGGAPGTPKYFLDEGVKWILANLETDENGVLSLAEAKEFIGGNSSAFKSDHFNIDDYAYDNTPADSGLEVFFGSIESGMEIMKALSEYNNHGTINGVFYAPDADIMV